MIDLTNNFQTICLMIALVGYGFNLVILFRFVFLHRFFNMSLAKLVLGIAIVAHGCCVLPSLHVSGGLSFSVFNSLSLTTFLVSLFSFIFSSIRPVYVLNMFSIPLAVVGLTLGYVFHNVESITPMPSMLLLAHIFLSISAYCILLMATAHSLIYSLQNKELKQPNQSKNWVQVMPPLLTMETQLFDMIYLGFGLLSFALVFGAIDTQNLLTQHLTHKTFFSVLSWLVFFMLIVGRLKNGWRGVRAVRYTLIGFILLLVGFIGSKFVLELLI